MLKNVTDSSPRGAAEAGAAWRRHRLYTAIGTALLVGALGYVGLADPHNPNSVYPPCPFKWLTGWNCPFCGGLRMTHDLLHGDLMASLNDNAFVLAGIPLLALWVLVRGLYRKPVLPIPAVVTIVVATIAWTVVRNLPGFPLIPTILSG